MRGNLPTCDSLHDEEDNGVNNEGFNLQMREEQIAWPNVILSIFPVFKL